MTLTVLIDPEGKAAWSTHGALNFAEVSEAMREDIFLLMLHWLDWPDDQDLPTLKEGWRLVVVKVVLTGEGAGFVAGTWENAS